MDVSLRVGDGPTYYIKKHDLKKCSDDLPKEGKEIILSIKNIEKCETHYVLAKMEGKNFWILEKHMKMPRVLPIINNNINWEIISWYEPIKFAKNTNTIMTKVN